MDCRPRSALGDVDDGFGKGLRGFLQQIVPDTALDDPLRIAAWQLFLGEMKPCPVTVFHKRPIRFDFRPTPKAAAPRS
jgi:hypothetical protein